MQDLFGSVRRSLVFRTPNSDEDAGAGAGIGGFVDKIGASIRSSRIGLFTKQSPVRALLPPSPAKENLPPMGEDGRISPAPVRKLAPVKDEARLRETRLEEDVVAIRWRKGELIGCGAFGRVYMGMNLDSGELLAVKQVLIANSGASKEKTQAHIRELEEEVNLLKNLSHPNIVRYLGTAREEEALNILLEFVPGGSISSLLGKFGSFPEPVIRMYTKQLLLGLEYLHKNGIMHRDIKGANILVDNKGCIKLADFGASKKVVELATMTGAKSMKGTPYWMAPEVILQTGHSFSADIWSVGCTVIEMATGKPPWSQQFQEVAALFHIGTTKSHPPIPEQLSTEAKNFLLKCLQKEPNLRPLASDLLEHPFVIGEYRESHPVYRPPTTEEAGNHNASPQIEQKSIKSHLKKTISGGLKDICNMGSVRCSTVYPEKFSGTCSLWDTDGDDDMCLLDDKDEFEFGTSEKLNPALLVDDLCQSFNPICEPNDDWPCNSVENPNVRRREASLLSRDASGPTETCNEETVFAFPSGASADDDDEVTEFKIKAFLDEKALELKKLQTPLYKEFYNSLNSASPVDFGATDCDNLVNDLPSKIKSPRRVHSRRLSNTTDIANTTSPGSRGKYVPDSSGIMEKPLKEHPEKELQEGFNLSPSFSERQRIWKEELAKELEIQRERLRLAGVGGKISSPNKRLPSQRERLPFASPAK